MATLTIEELTKAGITPSLVAVAAGGDQYSISGKEFLIIANGHASNPRTITVDANDNCSQGFDHDVAIVVAALTTVHVGPFERGRFNDGLGFAQLTYSDSGADITIAVVRNPA